MRFHSVPDAVLFAVPVLFLGLLSANQSSAQSFTLVPNPSVVTIHPGDQNVPINVSVTAHANTYSGPIIITLAGLPSGITASPLTLTSGNSGTLNLSASVSADQEDFPPTTLTPVSSHTSAARGSPVTISTWP